MKLLKKAVNQTKYLKAGIHGFQGSGKTFTGMQLAIGLAKTIGDGKPVAMLDTETGSDFLIPVFDEAGIELLVLKSRAFKDLLAVIDEAEKNCSVLIIDSITHVWTDLTRSFEDAKKRRGGLLFQDWNPIKREWSRFTTKYINSQLHIVMCGRAGFEYDMYENEAGKKELIKTGNKMKAEVETGFEPNLGLFMERIKKSSLSGNPNEPGIINRCHVEKDRSQRMNGAIIDYPKFRDFQPVVDFLNLKGDHVGVDASRTSEDMFSNLDTSAAQYRRQCEIALELLKDQFTFQNMSFRSADGSKEIKQILQKVFGTTSWKAVEEMPLDKLEAGLAVLKQHFNPEPEYTNGEVPPDQEPTDEVGE